MLDKKAKRIWGRKESSAFSVKKLLSSDSILVQYNETLPLILTCDASPFGVRAVISHQMPNGAEAPIAFYSKILLAAERKYSQLGKEALAAMAGVKWFHEYLYGRDFEIITQLLLGILAGDHPTLKIYPCE